MKKLVVVFLFLSLLSTSRKCGMSYQIEIYLKGPSVSPEEGRALVAEYKRQYADYKRRGGTRSYGSWVKWKGYGKGLKGSEIDIHKAILKVAPKKGFRHAWT